MMKVKADYERVIRIRSHVLEKLNYRVYCDKKNIEIVNISAVAEGYVCVMTQEYFKDADAGHYKYYVTNQLGYVVDAGCSIAGMPSGKITGLDAMKAIADFLDNRVRYVEAVLKQ